jgi:hypothetical protein
MYMMQTAFTDVRVDIVVDKCAALYRKIMRFTEHAFAVVLSMAQRSISKANPRAREEKLTVGSH